MSDDLHELGKKDANAFRLAYELPSLLFYTAYVSINSANFLYNKAMDTTAREEKNRQIAESIKATFLKRKGQVCHVYTVKIQETPSRRAQDDVR